MRLISDSSSPATMMALTPWSVRLEWASWPVTSVEKVMALLWAFTTFIEVGSPTMTARGFGRWSRIWATSGRTPLQPTSSSQDSARWMGDSEPGRLEARAPWRGQTARKPFMSQVPRPIEPAVALRQLEGIAGPVLAVDRHHVGVAREHDAARDVRADGGEEIGLLARLVVDPEMRNAPAVEIVLDEFDQGNVAVAAGGVEGDEARQHLFASNKFCPVMVRQLMACLSCGLSSEKAGISTLKSSPCCDLHLVGADHEARGRLQAGSRRYS